MPEWKHLVGTDEQWRDAMETLAEEIVTGDVNCYQYRDSKLDVIWVTSAPKDDEAAVAYFHSICRFGRDFKPVYVEKKVLVEGRERYRALPFTFDPDTFTTTEK